MDTVIDRKKLLKPLTILMFLMFAANTLALKLFWYYSIWWFDMPMHFLGGFWVGLFFIWFFSMGGVPYFKLSLEKVNQRFVLKAILFVLIAGGLWEFFEIFMSNYIGHDDFNIIDTVSDMCFDLSGGFFAIVYSAYLSRQHIMLVKGNKVE